MCFLSSSYGSGVLFQALNKGFASFSPWFLPVFLLKQQQAEQAWAVRRDCWKNGLILGFLLDFWATWKLFQLSLQPLSNLGSGEAPSESQRGFNCTLISDFMAGAVATGGRQDPHINSEYGYGSQRFPTAFMMEPGKKCKRNLESWFLPELEHLKFQYK